MTEQNKPKPTPLQQQKKNDNASSGRVTDGVKNALKMIWSKLNRMKNKLGFNTLSDEFNEFRTIQDKYVRNKAQASIDDSLMGEIESEMESLLGRLEIYDSLEPDEVKMLKGVEKPFTIFGQKIELKNYKKIGTIVMYVGGIYVGYQWILKPIVFPVVKKIMTTQVKKKKEYSSGLRDADYTVI